jgi:ankyrin repeat protein
LAVAIKLGDLKAVRYLLKKKASPTLRCMQSMIWRPLDLAAWDNKPDVVQILLESGGLRANGKSCGGLHGAIEHKMFKTIRKFIIKGCHVNEKYFDVTPLGASLTCGKSGSGDARVVKLVLDAKADVLALTKMCSSHYDEGKLTNVLELARTYSSSKCAALIEAAYSSARLEQ